MPTPQVEQKQRRKSSVGVAMDSLKVAAGKIKKSPRALKSKIGNALNKERLTEDWIHNRENVQNGVVFNMKILGKKIAVLPQGKGCTDTTVEELVQQQKMKGKQEKLLKVSMRVDSKKMIIRDLVTHELLEDIPVHRVSYCTADPNYPKVFALIARERGSKQLFTHVFLTNKKEMAEAIALTVAQAFTMAYDEWEEKSKERQHEVEEEQANDALELYGDLGERDTSTNPFKAGDGDVGEAQSNGFDFVSNNLAPKIETVEIIEPDNDDNDSSSDDGDDFLRLARERSASSGRLFDTGLVRRETFKGNITEYLAVNNTLTDLEFAKSTEDLTQLHSSPIPSPIPSPTSSPRNRNNRNRNHRNPFQNTTSDVPSQQQAEAGNLIEF